MPELPEVETLRRSLEPAILGRTIAAATVRRRDVVVGPNDPPGGFSRQRRAGKAEPPKSRLSKPMLLEGATVTELRRRGKALAIIAEHPDVVLPQSAIVAHLGMTGTLRYAPPNRRVAPNTHIHVLWRFLGGGRLVFQDPRRFGLVRLFPDAHGLDEHWEQTLGPDALEISADRLRSLSDSARPIKAALLDQAAIAGVGNIYADEALFAAGIHPATLCEQIGRQAWTTLARTIRSTLRAAVAAGGSSIRDYADADGKRGDYQHRHAVYGRSGLPCRVCSETLCSGILASRTTVWCPVCQPPCASTYPHLLPTAAERGRQQRKRTDDRIVKRI